MSDSLGGSAGSSGCAKVWVGQRATLARHPLSKGKGSAREGDEVDVGVRQLRPKHGEDAPSGVADLHAHRLHRRRGAHAVREALLVHGLGHEVGQPGRARRGARGGEGRCDGCERRYGNEGFPKERVLLAGEPGQRRVDSRAHARMCACVMRTTGSSCATWGSRPSPPASASPIRRR